MSLGVEKVIWLWNLVGGSAAVLSQIPKLQTPTLGLQFADLAKRRLMILKGTSTVKPTWDQFYLILSYLWPTSSLLQPYEPQRPSAAHPTEPQAGVPRASYPQIQQAWRTDNHPATYPNTRTPGMRIYIFLFLNLKHAFFFSKVSDGKL